MTATVYTEAGLFETVPERANRELARACREAGVNALAWLLDNYETASLDVAMHHWQTYRRIQVGKVLGVTKPLFLEQYLYLFGNPDRFCKALCIPPAALHQYRVGDVRSIPEVIRTALHEAGLPLAD